MFPQPLRTYRFPLLIRRAGEPMLLANFEPPEQHRLRRHRESTPGVERHALVLVHARDTGHRAVGRRRTQDGGDFFAPSIDAIVTVLSKEARFSRGTQLFVLRTV